MKRFLLILATLLALALPAAWAAGEFHAARLYWNMQNGPLICVSSAGGSMELMLRMYFAPTRRIWLAADESPRPIRRNVSMTNGLPDWYRFGFEFFHTLDNGDSWVFGVPAWFATAAAVGCAAAMWIAAVKSWRIRKPGFCHKWGYDLRASVDRCPECGVVIPAAGKLPA